MKRLILAIVFSSVLSGTAFTQGTGISATGVQPDPSAMLDITSNDKGLLIPRMTDGARDSIVAPAEGLLIFNTTTKCFNVFKSGSWFEWCGSCVAPQAPLAGGNGPICAGSTINLTASNVPNVTYQWVGPNGFTSTQQNPVITNATTANSGSYQVRTNNSNCSSTWSNVTVTVNGIPSSGFTFAPNPASLNQGTTFTPVETGATYSWAFQSGSPATSTVQNPVITWTSTGTYNATLSVTRNGCNSTITTVPVTVNACASGTVTFNYSGSIVTYQFPANACGIVTIDVRGAQGGNAGSYTGGLGARVVGDFTGLAGQTIRILVGQQGITAANTSSQAGGTGGGGSFVTLSNNSPLIVAGGGGGAVNYTGTTVCPGGPGQITNNGQAGGGSGGGAGGTGGGGGTTVAWTGWHTGTGGGGLTGNGIGNSSGDPGYGTVNGPGIAFINGGAGGTGGSLGRNGGYGGGGAAGFTGGGGGGYSGGGCANFQGSPAWGGGGGGSYNGGTNQTNTSGYQSGNGQVIITW